MDDANEDRLPVGWGCGRWFTVLLWPTYMYIPTSLPHYVFVISVVLQKMQLAQMVMFAWRTETHTRVELSFACMENGVLSVMTGGTIAMLRWSATSWDSQSLVRLLNVFS